MLRIGGIKLPGHSKKEKVVNLYMGAVKGSYKGNIVPLNYKKGIFNILQRVKLGNKSVEEFVQEMEVTLIKT